MATWKSLPLLLILGAPSLALAAIPAQLYKNPQCTCCDAYARYLDTQGFAVQMHSTTDMAAVKQKYAVPPKLEGCHTLLVGNYVFEGLIPAEYLQRVLKERRPIRGLSLPGMPVGAPGMPGNKAGALYVYYLENAATPKVFASF